MEILMSKKVSIILITIASFAGLYLFTNIGSEHSAENEDTNAATEGINSSISSQQRAGQKVTTRSMVKGEQKSAPKAVKQEILDEFSTYPPQQIAVELFTDVRVKGNSTALLLELIQKGIIGVNESLKAGATHYTPLYVALASGNDLTEAELQQFFDLGAFAGASKPWLRAMPALHSKKTLQLWAEHSGVGPEHYDNLLLYALIRGNPTLDAFIREKIPHEADTSHHNDEVVVAAYTTVVQEVNADLMARILNSDNPHKKANLMSYKSRLQRRLGQIEVLIKQDSLTPEQKTEIKTSREQYQRLIAQVTERIDTL
ncbi:hypothetical protein [Idiomarina aminovorans]|uniref:hypothetical protein n=1 Tax=Idiomarina aminovorans TaxID=2914829 RepID=UPI0020068418|nr:hypothetical protein [Idiomarina sp. ATCH4]MCK7458849.1 hypothetical protein [Idiomarina sp. ATCH4]